MKVKVKWSRYRPGVAQRVGRGIAVLFHDRSTRREWVVSSTPRPYFTPGRDPVPILQEAGWAPGPVWTGGKSRPTGIRSRTVQPVVSRYTDWATGPNYMKVNFTNARSEVLTAVLMENHAVWDKTPFRLVSSFWHFEVAFCLHIQSASSQIGWQHIKYARTSYVYWTCIILIGGE